MVAGAPSPRTTSRPGAGPASPPHGRFTELHMRLSLTRGLPRDPQNSAFCARMPKATRLSSRSSRQLQIRTSSGSRTGLCTARNPYGSHVSQHLLRCDLAAVAGLHGSPDISAHLQTTSVFDVLAVLFVSVSYLCVAALLSPLGDGDCSTEGGRTARQASDEIPGRRAGEAGQAGVWSGGSQREGNGEGMAGQAWLKYADAQE